MRSVLLRRGRPGELARLPAVSFARASVGSSLSKIPAICLTCWPKALYGRALAVRCRAAADDAAALSCDELGELERET